MDNPDVVRSREAAAASGLSAESSGELLAAWHPENRRIPELAWADIPHHSLGVPSNFWVYRNQTGDVLGARARFDPRGEKKILLPLKFVPAELAGHWEWSGFWSDKKPLYGLDGLAKRPSDPVLLVEGEKTADAAQALFLDHVALTWGGTGETGIADLSPLANRAIIIWADHDEPGMTAAKRIASRLRVELTVPSVKMVQLPESLPEKWDLADEVPQGIDVHALLAEAQEIEPPNGDEDSLARLAALSPLDYDRQREGEAERLGIRLSTLDAEVKARQVWSEESGGGFDLVDPAPWSQPVDGAKLLEELTAVVTKYMALPMGAAVAVALWIMHSHAHMTATISPILAVTSPTPECGKTTLLTLLQALTPRAVMAANITAAALYRTVEKLHPTLIIDEADTFLRDNDELRGVLNSGHNRAAAYVIRTTGDNHDPRRFNTWSPKAIALIGKLPPTLQSRAIHIELQRMSAGDNVEQLRSDRLDHLEPLCRMAWRWACDNQQHLAGAEPEIPPALRGRRADNWRHLLTIADAAGGEWPEKARQVAAMLSAAREDDTAGIMLLEDIRRIFEGKKKDRLPSAEIVTELGTMDERPWPEWKGKPITQPQLAKLLSLFKIHPVSIRIPAGQPKGYHLKSFDAAFSRYLPVPAAATPPQPAKTNGFNANSGRHNNAADDRVVADEIALALMPRNACGGVADAQEAWEEEL